MIHFSCPNCGKGIKVGDTAAGKDGKCPACGGAVHVPGAPVTSGPPPLNSNPATAAIPDGVSSAVEEPTEQPLGWLRGGKRKLIVLGACLVFLLPALAVLLTRPSKPAVPEMFKTQLMKFVEEGTKMCEQSGQGISYLELREQLASVKGAYSLCKATWPKSLPVGMTAEFDRAIAAWDLVLDIWKNKIDRPHAGDDEVKPNEFDLGQFEDLLLFNTTRVRSDEWDSTSNSWVPRERDSDKMFPRSKNISILLSIASDNFTAGRTKILAELQ